MPPFLLVFRLAFGGPAAPPPPDRWFAEDKLKHFAASFVVTALAGSAARTAGLKPEESVAVGAGAGVAIGAWKELRDLRTPGETASLRDLAWDLAGTGAAAAVLAQAR